MTQQQAVPLARHMDPRIAEVPVGEFNIYRLRLCIEWAIQEFEHSRTKGGPWSWDQGTWGDVTAATAQANQTEAEEVTDDEGDTVFAVPVVCASAACLAGNAVLTEGDRFVIDYGDWESLLAGNASDEDDYVSAISCIDEQGNIYDIAERGQVLLGLTGAERVVLFDGNNEIDRVCYAAEWIAQNHGTHLDLPEAEQYINQHITTRGNVERIDWEIAR